MIVFVRIALIWFFSFNNNAVVKVRMRDLEAAFAGDALDAKSRTAHATNLGLLSAGIYNMVAFEKNEKRRGTLIKEEAKGFARAAVLLEQRSSIDET